MAENTGRKSDKPDIFRIALIGLGIVVVLAIILAVSGGNEYGYNPRRAVTLISLIAGFALGAMLAGIFLMLRHLFTKHGKLALVLGAGVLILIGDILAPFLSVATSGLAGLAGFLLGIALILYLFVKVTPGTKLPNVFGSSRWATRGDLDAWGLLGELDAQNGLFLGKEADTGQAIVYEGDMHALTVAPTRTGKGATAIIPNLLRSDSSILVIDPKGENARRTVTRRLEMGQDVRVIDPWRVALEADKYGPGIKAEYLARFNPLSALRADDPDLASDAMLLADALVVTSGKDPFWSDEAKALIYGFILHVVTDPEEDGQRHLGRVRDILSLPPGGSGEDDDLTGTMDEILLRMGMSDNALVRAAAHRVMQKEARERAGVISSAQSNTHFLDSPKIRQSLSGDDFRFSELKTHEKGITAYLVLPLDRLPSFNRWLRLLVTSALIDLTRTPAQEGKPPVRVILDEFAALQKLSLIETAYGTMAGLGVQLWAVTQDLGQLMRLYGDKSWQTFVSNAGVFQYFGSRDYETAKYAEHLCGMTTMKKRSISFGKNWGTSSSSGPGGGSSSSSSGGSETTSYDDVSRPLAYADEMMTLHRDLQVLFVENRYPIIAKKHWWFIHHSPTRSLEQNPTA